MSFLIDNRWYNNPRPLPYMKAAHQAAVEIGLMQMLGGKVTLVSKPSSRAIEAQLKSVKIEGEAGNWGDRLQFPDIKTMESLLRNAAGAVDGKAGETALQEKLKAASEQGDRLYGAESKGQKQNSLSSLSLADGNVKFVVRIPPFDLFSANIANKCILVLRPPLQIDVSAHS